MKNVIVGVAGVGGLFLGIVIARVIGMADGLGAGIGMMAGIMIGKRNISKWKKLFYLYLKLTWGFESLFDKYFMHKDVPMSNKISHQKWQQYLYSIGNHPGMKILEIGSREVTGDSNARNEFSNAEYVGFDYYSGNNVDVIGDAHKLSSYFKEGEKFDIIFSSACFEHFAMPWVVATEISKILKVGGIVFVETHFSFSSHERPWHFFQFSDMALKVLFSEPLGFECIESGMSNPMIGRFSSLADDYLKNRHISGLYCHSEYLGKKVKEIKTFNWENESITKLVGSTQYPEMK